MSLGHGPKLVTNGLVFAYDMNPIINGRPASKSWRGAPTTNYLNGSTSGTYPDAFRVVSYAGDGARSEVGTSKFGTNIIQWTAAGSTYIYTQDQILDDDLATLSGQTVTFSLYIRRLEGSATGRIRVYDNISGYSYQSVSVTSDFQRVEMTKTLGANPTRIFVMLDSTGGGTYQFHSPQLEISSFATPFSYSSRSTTEALIDWTGNNTITANSLTYNSGGSFSFNGTTNFARFGNNTAISSIGGTSSITVESWVKYDSYVGSGGSRSYSVVTHKGAPWTWLMENPSNKGRIRFTIGGTDVNCADPDVHPLNTWMHWVGTYDGSNMKFYRNGILKNTVARTGTLGSNSTNAEIGQYSNDYRMDGDIGAVKIYNRALSAAEVQQNFNALRGRYGI